jgi:hypothetical protein
MVKTALSSAMGVGKSRKAPELRRRLLGGPPALLVDPLGFDAGDSNLYRYVNNAPILGSDPSGLQEWGTPGYWDGVKGAPGAKGFSQPPTKKLDLGSPYLNGKGLEPGLSGSNYTMKKAIDVFYNYGPKNSHKLADGNYVEIWSVNDEKVAVYYQKEALGQDELGLGGVIKGSTFNKVYYVGLWSGKVSDATIVSSYKFKYEGENSVAKMWSNATWLPLWRTAIYVDRKQWGQAVFSFIDDVDTVLIGSALAGAFVRSRRSAFRMPSADRFPSRDASGRIHGDIPNQVPGNWRRGEIQDALAEVEGSLGRRRGNQQIFGPDRAHDVRIIEEEVWRRQLQRRLEELR